MNHQSSYQAPRSERTSSNGSSYTTRGHRNRKKNPYSRTSWKDNPILRNLVFYILPFFVINGLIFFFAVYTPKIELTVGDTTDYRSVEVSFRIKSLIPLKNTTVTLDSQPLEVTKEGKEYRATLTTNGVVQVSAEGINGMSRTVFEHVGVLDDTPPTIEEDYTLDSDFLTITVSDALSGVDYDHIYGLDEDHQQVEPVSLDRDTGTVVFPMSGNTITVHIQDFAGNVTEPSYSIRLEGVDEESEASEDENENDEESSDDSEKESSSKETVSSTTAAKSAAKSTTAAKATTAAKSAAKATTAAKSTTKSTTAAKETTKATTAAKETTKATTAAKETTKATTAAKETTKATTAAGTAASRDTTAAPTVPSTTAAAGPGGTSGPGSTTAAAEQPANPAGNSGGDTIIPLN